jgi:hypothetical protein
MSIQRLKDPEAINSAIREFDRLGRTAFLKKYGFGKAREYMLRNSVNGSLYDSKAIIGAAFGFAFPDEGPLRNEDFSGGEATVEPILVALGFEVVRIGQDWTPEEVKFAVYDYFQMLTFESKGQTYNKSEHNERLREKLTTRSRSSIELKHQNISAVLDLLGLPYIGGYKPRYNLQEFLRQAVQEYVESHRQDLSVVLDNIEARTVPGNRKYSSVLIEPPSVKPIESRGKRIRLPKKFDYAARDENNRKLGYTGESWVVGYEQARLCEEGRPDLVPRIDWVSDRVGDGTGYDILSFEASEVARFIEVKTTNGGPLTPFIVTRNELEFSAETEDSFCLYRIFDFGASPGLFILRGPLSSNVALEPIDYRARLKSLR